MLRSLRHGASTIFRDQNLSGRYVVLVGLRKSFKSWYLTQKCWQIYKNPVQIEDCANSGTVVMPSKENSRRN